MGKHSGESCRLSVMMAEPGMEMPVYGKPGKNDETVFPTLPTDLGNRYCRFPHSHATTTTTRMNISSNPPAMGYALEGQGQRALAVPPNRNIISIFFSDSGRVLISLDGSLARARSLSTE